MDGTAVAARSWLSGALALALAAACAGREGSPAPAAEPPLPEGAVVYRADFDAEPVGPYTVAQLRAGWNDPSWENGVSAGRVEIVAAPLAYSGRSLCVRYPRGGVGPGAGGAQWQLRLGKSYTELYCSYRIRFGDGFDFVKGGKLPGLAGGEANTGGNRPNGRDGWSARMMWRKGGRAVQYLYHPDQPTIYGLDLPWDVGGQRLFAPGVWHRVEHRVVMNTPGRQDGLVQAWFDGVLALDTGNLRFRDVDSFAIDLFYFSTFFGGNDASWAPTRDESVCFDDFVIAGGRMAGR
jgi:hypothetical protein